MFNLSLQKIFIIISVLFICLSCSKGETTNIKNDINQNQTTQFDQQYVGNTMNNNILNLDKIAETERTKGFTPGLGLAESSIREKAGDFAGAVIAAYKELSWSYAYNNIASGQGVTKKNMLEGLNNVLIMYSNNDNNTETTAISEESKNAAKMAANAAIYFTNAQWNKSRVILEKLFNDEEETDSFSQWMILVCLIEEGDLSRSVRSKYGAIRARYEYFPEYWYHAARFSVDRSASENAEICINLAPNGPYAAECRQIIAVNNGLTSADLSSIRTKTEIETIITNSISSRNPEILIDLFPLISLPDNPYTLYAVGALRALASEELFKKFYIDKASKSSKRLAERLNYISRG